MCICVNYLSFTATYAARSDATSLIESREYFRHTTMRYEQLSWNVARPYTDKCELYDSLSHAIGQGSSIYKDTTQLIDTSLTWKKKKQIT